MSHNRIRAFNKRITNRITSRIASFSCGPFALVRHVGRRSGKLYETPIMVEPTAEGFVIALTYGESVDWYRNVLAAGHVTLRWHGRDYELGKPEPVAVQTALHPHLDAEYLPTASLAHLEKWAAGVEVPAYAIDDQTALKVIDGEVSVVSEGHWKRFTP